MENITEKSATRVKALRKLVDKGFYPVEYGLMKLDELNEKGLVTANDYDETFVYFFEILNKEEEEETVEEDSSENEQTESEEE